MSLLQRPFYLRGVVVVEGYLVAYAEEVRRPRESAGALEVYQAVEPLADRGAEAPIKFRVDTLQILGHIVPDEYRVEPQDMPLPHGLAFHLVLREVHAPDVEGVHDPPLFLRGVESVPGLHRSGSYPEECVPYHLVGA